MGAGMSSKWRDALGLLLPTAEEFYACRTHGGVRKLMSLPDTCFADSCTSVGQLVAELYRLYNFTSFLTVNSRFYCLNRFRLTLIWATFL
jgi:hypothetical protein